MNIELHKEIPFRSLTYKDVLQLCTAVQRVIRIPKSFTLSIAIVSSRSMQRLNHLYRHKNFSTDVLSFLYSAQSGEIVLSAQDIRSQAKKFHHSFRTEALFLCIHGLLHLQGFDHERSKKEAAKMESLEQSILRICGLASV